MKKNRKTIPILLLVLCLTLQLFAVLNLTAAGTRDLTPLTDHLSIHNTTDTYATTGGPSSIAVTVGSSVIKPSGKTFSDVPAGAGLTLTYVFHLEDGDGEGEIYTYNGSDYFTITLPEGVTFTPPTGENAKIYATDLVTGVWQLGTWSFTGDNVITVHLTADAANHSGIWGKVGITGTFDPIPFGGDDETSIKLGSETYLFTRKTDPKPEVSLAKSGVYDAATNSILWTVTVTPPAGTDLGGYTLVDTYSVNQTYRSGSFTVGTSSSAVAVPDLTLGLSTANQVSYTFPAHTTAAQIITYQTNPKTFSAETGATAATESSTFSNSVTLKTGSTVVKGPVDASVPISWLNKAVSNVTTSGSYIRKWVVTVTVGSSSAITGATVSDLIPAGLQLVDDSTYDVTVALNGGTASVIPSSAYTYSYTDAATASAFSYAFPGALSGTAVLTYYTKLNNPDSYLNFNTAVTFKNNAALTWAEMPDSANPPKDNASTTIVGANGLIAKSADATSDYANPGIIHWTITVNSNKINMTGVTIGDSIPLGQQLYIDATHPITVKQGSSTLSPTGLTSSDSFVRDFSYYFGDINTTYTVDFYTKVIDTNPAAIDTSGLDTLYSNGDSNGRVAFKNDVTLYRSGETPIKVTGTRNFNTQMLAKAAENYNYAEHTVKWTITVNRNKLPLTGLTISDSLPAGMKLYIDAVHPFLITDSGSAAIATMPTVGASGSTAFNYGFGTGVTVSDRYTVTFYTRLDDSVLLTQWANTQNFVNTATISADQMSRSITATATAQIQNPVVSKTAAYTAGNDYIEWTVNINSGLLKLTGASVTDVLNAGLLLDNTSVKLYAAAVGTDGTLTTGALIPAGYSVTLPTSGNHNTLTVGLPDGANAYRLKFTTFIITDNYTYDNTVSLSGSNGTPSGNADVRNIQVGALWSSGGSGSLPLTVHKTNADGNPVPGAVYQLLNASRQPIYKNGSAITATTGSNGTATFTNLPAWTFYVKEIATPDGYLLNSEPFGGVRLASDTPMLETVDAYAKGSVSLYKVSTLGASLSGGNFVLSGTDFFGHSVTIGASAVGGVVTFENVPLSGNTPYTITETDPPVGHLESSTVLTARVVYNGDKTAVVAQLSADRLINTPYSQLFGSITLHKTDSDGKALPGALFGLYDSTGALVASTRSDASGVVKFSELPLGTYTLRELEAPDGYNLSETVCTATIPPKNRDVITNPATVVDEALSELRILKVDSVTQKSLSGVEFTLFDKTGKAVQTAVTDVGGFATFSRIKAGNYTLRETKTPTGYLQNNDIPVIAKGGTTLSYIIKNTPVPTPVSNPVSSSPSSVASSVTSTYVVSSFATSSRATSSQRIQPASTVSAPASPSKTSSGKGRNNTNIGDDGTPTKDTTPEMGIYEDIGSIVLLIVSTLGLAVVLISYFNNKQKAKRGNR
ncbi:MAG TPA: SpaA isopeptide-forming pilin-related protein [Oscillospiraceae bacterium]|nr:SpaA isopeptide-forming pilin-related protein [Oscillospiraceae bacterium]HPS34211.1 SpaA isopeptide-forming pilin-related protein [Oscillospiraceae bacterium]